MGGQDAYLGRCDTGTSKYGECVCARCTGGYFGDACEHDPLPIFENDVRLWLHQLAAIPCLRAQRHSESRKTWQRLEQIASRHVKTGPTRMESTDAVSSTSTPIMEIAGSLKVLRQTLRYGR